MAYQGGIDYLDLPFDRIDWEEHDILSPWSSYQPGTTSSSSSGKKNILLGLSVIPRRFDIETVPRKDSMLIYDTPSSSVGAPPGLKCVILGKMRKSLRPEHERLHYVMLVRPRLSTGTNSKMVYERVGVGYMPGYLIHVDGPAPVEMVY